MKPTSKIIQIQIDSEQKVLIALCEDGSVWERQPARRDPDPVNTPWRMILDPFQESSLTVK